MTKDIIKEIIIALLICLAIIGLWFVILYRFVPFGKKIPDNISYTTPADVKQALKSINAVNEDEVILTYEINQSDLTNYQRINEYKPGKTNPFSSFEKNVEETTGTIGGGSGNNGGGSSSGGGSYKGGSTGGTTGGSEDTSEPGTVNPGIYVPDKGTK